MPDRHEALSVTKPNHDLYALQLLTIPCAEMTSGMQGDLATDHPRECLVNLRSNSAGQLIGSGMPQGAFLLVGRA